MNAVNKVVRILAIEHVTHDVKCFKIEKPAGFQFVAGQATDVAVNKPGFEGQKRPFTFTSLNEDPYLEFTIKRYEEHHGVTDQIHQMQLGDEFIIEDAWGAIEYKGPGYFIAGGAGITPFMAILRKLHKEGATAGNTLFFSNKTAADIIYQQELTGILGADAHYILSNENKEGFKYGLINDDFIKENITDFNKNFYVCGPDKMVTDIVAILQNHGAHVETLVFEK